MRKTMGVAALLAALAAVARPGAAGNPPKKDAPPAPAAAAGAGEESFRAVVAPLLLTRCSPCHAPGGKMYAKLPFDKAETIRSHVPGVMKRLKGEDKETVQAWLDGK